MITFFIADLHLQEKEPVITAGFLHFLHNEALYADALYILGDLFEIWIGDDDPRPLCREMATAIKKLVNSGVFCYFIHGNRDFLIGKRFAKESGMILLPEKQILDLYGHKILIMHGDILCTKDTEYQNFRIKVRTFWIQKLFLSLPLNIRNYIFNKICISSKISRNRKSIDTIDINQQTIIEIMEKYNVQWLICGHTHNPIVHKFIANDQPASHIVLGAWKKKGSTVKVTPNNVELIHFPL